ncbi:hypothetical protein F4809DRAFT_266071 [Biscogniauxia mediterranea]|nr:hypothetical protein F4809DRAFT_266071 [Biscogniauxia mediterranea]
MARDNKKLVGSLICILWHLGSITSTSAKDSPRQTKVISVITMYLITEGIICYPLGASKSKTAITKSQYTSHSLGMYIVMRHFGNPITTVVAQEA